MSKSAQLIQDASQRPYVTVGIEKKNKRNRDRNYSLTANKIVQ